MNNRVGPYTLTTGCVSNTFGYYTNDQVGFTKVYHMTLETTNQVFTQV